MKDIRARSIVHNAASRLISEMLTTIFGLIILKLQSKYNEKISYNSISTRIELKILLFEVSKVSHIHIIDHYRTKLVN